MTHLTRILYLAALLPVVALAQDKCTVDGMAEQDRIIREYSSQPPTKGDSEAERAWARKLHDALAAAAKRAEDCSRANKPAVPPAAIAKERECMAAVERKMDQLHKRWGGRTLSAQEQATQRAEEERLHEERIGCSRR